MAHTIKTGHIMIIAGVVIVVLSVAAALFFMQNRSDEYTRRTLSETRANAPANLAACTAKSDSRDLNIPSSDQTDIFNSVVTSIIDIPAGTDVNVYVGAYDGATAGGSIVYAGDYGSYNFTATKNNTSQSAGINWTVKTFVACK